MADRLQITRRRAGILALAGVALTGLVGCVSDQTALGDTADPRPDSQACRAAAAVTESLEVGDGQVPDLDLAARRLAVLATEVPAELQPQVEVLLASSPPAPVEQAAAAWEQLGTWSAVMCERRLVPAGWQQAALEEVGPQDPPVATRRPPADFAALVTELVETRDGIPAWVDDEVRGTVSVTPEALVVTVDGAASATLGLQACTELAAHLADAGPLVVVVRDRDGAMVALTDGPTCRAAAGVGW